MPRAAARAALRAISLRVSAEASGAEWRAAARAALAARMTAGGERRRAVPSRSASLEDSGVSFISCSLGVSVGGACPAGAEGSPVPAALTDAAAMAIGS